MDPAIFKSYDIRGIYPSELDEEDVYKITKSFFTFVVGKLGKTVPPEIVLSYDGRLSSPSLADRARKALIESGAEVIDIGLSSTPTFYFAVYHYGYDAGIQISASHNPKEYNGLKPVIKIGSDLTKIGEGTGLEEIKKTAQAERFVTLEELGKLIKKTGAASDQVENALQITGNPKVVPLKVVADAANGTGAIYLEELFKKLPGELVKLNFKIDGSFPSHKPDPSQTQMLSQLQEKVVSEKADLGIAPDGDSDRLFFVDEKGGAVPVSVILIVLSVISREKKPLSEILKPLSVSFQAEQINIKITDPQKVIESLRSKYENGQINFIDGLSVDFPNWRFNIRLSNTEPVVRLNVEALNKKLMEEKKEEIVKIINSYK